MKALLVAVDGSKNGLRAVGHARALSKVSGAFIHLLNVQPPMDDYGMVPAFLSEQQHHKMAMERGQAILAPAVKQLEREGVPHAAHVMCGDIAETINRSARRLKCEAIIMGTRGMSSLGSLVLGSVANKVIHLTNRPVTLIK